jgi:hypothetical protein
MMEFGKMINCMVQTATRIIELAFRNTKGVTGRALDTALEKNLMNKESL